MADALYHPGEQTSLKIGQEELEALIANLYYENISCEEILKRTDARKPGSYPSLSERLKICTWIKESDLAVKWENLITRLRQ